MKLKRLGRTGLMVTENSFGALPIQRCSLESAVRLLHTAYDLGVNFFDTARFYTDSEEKIGLAFEGLRKNVYIATKSMNRTREGALAELDISLGNLRTGYVDLFQLHDIPEVPDASDPDSAYHALLQARHQGKCRFIGITTHRINVALEAARSGLFDTVQFPLCYLSAAEDLQLIDVCRQHDVGLIAMKAMSGGLLSSAKAAYAFMAGLPDVVPIWGVQTEAELEEFMSYSAQGVTMTPDLEAIIEKDKHELAGEFCRGCGYCIPTCPAGIDIKNFARMEIMLGRAPWKSYTTPQWIEKAKAIENCTKCGLCARKCPYGLDTPRLLEENYEFYMGFCREKEVL